MLYNIPIHRPQTNFCCAPHKTCPFEIFLYLGSSAATAPPGSPPSCDDMDMALAALLKRLQGNNAEELDGLLKDLPIPEPGAKGGISVKEAAEVCFICYIVCYIVCCITCYG